MVSRKKSRKASRKRRSSKPKKIGYYVKNGKVLIAYEGHNRQGKLVHKDSAGKTIRKTVKIHKLKRDANKHAKSKKGRKASRKSSRKRKSTKRKASRKRKSAKRKSRKRKSAKRKSRKRKSAKRKSRKRNFGFFTQRMRDSMRRKYQRTKDSFGRTFKGKDYIASHEFLPPRKLPANLYPMFIQKFPRFRGRNPSSNPILFPAKPGETASTFKRRIDRIFKNYRQVMYKKQYILARRNNKYRGSLKEHIADYKAEQAAREQAAAKQAHQKMVSLANSKSRKQCELIQKQIQLRRAKGLSITALDADFNRLCKGQTKQLVMRDALLAKRRRAFTASAKGFKNMKPADIKKMREHLAIMQAVCKKQGKIFNGRKDKKSGLYMCDAANPQKRLGDVSSTLVKQKDVNRAAEKAAEKADMAQWNRLPLESKAKRCKKGRDLGIALRKKGDNRSSAEKDAYYKLKVNYSKKKCRNILKQAEANINIDF